MVDKRTTELSLVFVVVGMMFLVPVITGQALGYTLGIVKTWSVPFTSRAPSFLPDFVEKRLDEGKWVNEPNCLEIKHSFFSSECRWTTEGNPKGGPEDMSYTITTIGTG